MKQCYTLLLTFLIFGVGTAQNTQDIQKMLPSLVDTYKNLHKHPELSFKEFKTSALLAEKMRSYGFKVTEKVGGTGVVAILKNGKGPKILIRTDMDALPILEKTGVSFASSVKQIDVEGVERPVMHACGHDIHMSVWLGTASYLATHKKEWKGTIMMIAQPAEERGGGSLAMLKDGLYQKFFVPDYAFALHVNSVLPAGKISYCPGFAMANVDMAKIKITGKGGHGAYPHEAIDPIVMGSQFVMDLQTIVSRETSPIDAAVVTVGLFQAGTKGNIIPTTANLELTVRTYKDEVRNRVIEAIKRKASAVALSFGIPKENYPVVKFRKQYTPALYNNPLLVNKVITHFNRVFGEDNIVKSDPVMGGEDFARYGKTKEKVPIFMFNLGIVNVDKYNKYKAAGKQLPSIHSDKMIPDPKPSIKTGITAMVTAVKSVLN